MEVDVGDPDGEPSLPLVRIMFYFIRDCSRNLFLFWGMFKLQYQAKKFLFCFKNVHLNTCVKADSEWKDCYNCIEPKPFV